MFNKIHEPKMDLDEVSLIISDKTKSKDSIAHFLDPLTQEILKNDEKIYINADEKFLKLLKKEKIYNFSKTDAIDIYNNAFKNHVRKKFLSEYLCVPCPICEQNRPNMTIDHVLPKSKFSQYTVTPVNLVPMCLDCNKSKGDSEIFFHPYYQDFSKLDGVEFLFSSDGIKRVTLRCDNEVLLHYLNVYGMDKKIEIDANCLYIKIQSVSNNEALSVNKIKERIKIQRDYVVDVPRWKIIFWNDLLKNIDNLAF